MCIDILSNFWKFQFDRIIVAAMAHIKSARSKHAISRNLVSAGCQEGGASLHHAHALQHVSTCTLLCVLDMQTRKQTQMFIDNCVVQQK